MKSHFLSLAACGLVFGLALSARPVAAEDVPEARRSPAGTAASVAVQDVAAPPVSWELLPEARVDSSGIFLNQIVKSTPPVVLPQIRLAPAPPLGQAMVLTRDQVLALARTNVAGMNATNWTGPLRARVARRTRELSEADMTSLLTGALQREYAKDQGELELHFARPWAPVAAPDEPLSVTLTEMPRAGVNSDFVAGFDLWNGKERVGHWQAVLQAKIWREIPLAHAALARGQLLRDADVVMERRDLLTVRDVVLDISKDDNSLALVENVAAGLPVPVRAVRPRPVVKRGQMVDGVFAQGALTISLKVEILEDGLLGQTVRVRNPKTRRELTGKVQNEETVNIAL
jgi:flagella basal body P-ring formation protein FlgA